MCDTGKYVDLSSGTIDYHFDSNGYDVGTKDGAGPSGTLFNLVDMNGSFDVAGNYNTGLQSASISGSLDYDMHGPSYWPEEFNPTDGFQASNWLDFGYYVYIDVNVASAYNLTFDENGFDGRLNGGFWLQTEMVVDWPNLTFLWEDGEPKEYTVTIGAAAEIYKKSNNDIWLEGSENTNDGAGGATFTLNGDSIDAPIYLYLGSI